MASVSGRRPPVFGLVGGPLNFITGMLVMFGAIDQGGTVQGLATIPKFIWELGLSLYPLLKGFRPSPILDEYDREVGVKARPVPAPA